MNLRKDEAVLIALKLDLQSIYSFSLTETKLTKYILNNDMFWMLRTKILFPRNKKPSGICWKEFHRTLTTGKLYVKGQNKYGQLGTGDFNLKPRLTRIRNHYVRKVSCGRKHTLIVTTAGELFSTGGNQFGQSGSFYDYGSDSDSDSETGYDRIRTCVPLKIKHDVMIHKISAGDYHSGFIDSNSQLYMFGYNMFGQLGCNDNLDKSRPVLIKNNIKRIKAGGDFTAIVDHENTLWTCGKNSDGQLGTRNYTNSKIFTPIYDNVNKIDCGYRHLCFTDFENNLYGCGSNIHRELCMESTNDIIYPIKLIEPKVSKFYCGYLYTVILFLTKKTKLYGNQPSVIGINLNQIFNSKYRSISVGFNHSALVKNE